MSAYYNEWDAKKAAWLRELIKQGLITDGIVDQRSICDVQPEDVRGFTQCHWFAGIGGWSYALRLAGWPDDRPVWSASLPCQPFSGAGKSRGASDDRHLWPHFSRLVRECRPVTIFGEQVAKAIGFNWLDGVCADLEGEAYSVGSAVLGAHSVGLPHLRQRLYWVADSSKDGRHGEGVSEIRREGLLQPPRSSHVPPRDGLPMPCNAKDFRDFLLLPDGIPGELDAYHALGDAIVPQVAAEFICAFEEARERLGVA